MPQVPLSLKECISKAEATELKSALGLHLKNLRRFRASLEKGKKNRVLTKEKTDERILTTEGLLQDI